MKKLYERLLSKEKEYESDENLARTSAVFVILYSLYCAVHGTEDISEKENTWLNDMASDMVYLR